MPVLRRQAAAASIGGGGDGAGGAALLPHAPGSRTRPTRTGRCSRAVHKTGAIGERGDDRARGERDDPAPRRPGRVHPRPDRSCWGGIRCGPGSSPRPSGPARTRTRSCGRPGTVSPGCSRSTPGKRPADGERRHPPRSLRRRLPPNRPRRRRCRRARCGRTRRDWALFTDWCAVTGNRELPADPGTVARVPHRLPGRAGDPAAPGRRDRPPPHRGRVCAARGVRSGVEPRSAGPPANRRPAPVETDGPRSRPRCAACPSRVDAGHVRPAGPLPAGAVPAGGGAVQAPGHLTAGDITVVDGTATDQPAPPAHGHFDRPTTTRAVWAVRDHPVAPGPRPGDDQTQPPRPGQTASTDADPVTDQSPHLCRSTRETVLADPGGAAAAADRPMGVRPVPAATAHPALAVPPGPGDAGR